MSRRHHSHQEDDTPEEWIWGNTRGGGGAPLKTLKGEQVANLRSVVRGGVEIDVESPSKHKAQRRSDREDRDDRSYGRDSDRRRRSNDRDRSRTPSPTGQVRGLENHYKDTPPQAKGFRNIQVDDTERMERVRYFSTVA
jgi:hypothetical protein